VKIAFVTGSPAKYAIAVEHVRHLGIQLEHVSLELVEIQSPSVEAIAEHKAAQAFDRLGRACMVEDSAFGIDELGGYPGTNVKHLIAAAGAKAVAHLAHLTTTRACTSTAALVYVDDASKHHVFTHTRAGTIALEPQGDAGRLPLWSVYIPPGATAPLAAMPENDRHAWHQQWQQCSVFAQFARWYSRHRERPAL
jgi:XTP/dITP diphosphohydrolase